jgi:hypothetical protein
LMLIHNNAEALEGLSDQELMERSGGFERIAATARELRENGELVSILRLDDPRTTQSVQLVAGTPVISDRPFLETKEFLAGALVVECETVERALEIAARIPLVELRRVEIHRTDLLDERDFEAPDNTNW